MVMAVADSDSYLKWSVATLRAMPARWRTTQVVIDSPVRPSAAQIQAAAGERVEVLSYASVIDRLRLERPDVVLLACTGPVVASVAADRLFRGRTRPVLVTGLPGISIPATGRAVWARAGCDLFLLHSHREIAEFTRLADSTWPELIFGLASLPFLPSRRVADDHQRAGTSRLRRAGQGAEPTQRSGADPAGPGRRRSGRGQVARGRGGAADPPRAVAVPAAAAPTWPPRAGSLPRPSAFSRLDGRGPGNARALVTVSSTAALEAMAVGLPTLIISDFGVSADMINTVFDGSGCLGTLDDLAVRHDQHAGLRLAGGQLLPCRRRQRLARPARRVCWPAAQPADCRYADLPAPGRHAYAGASGCCCRLRAGRLRLRALRACCGAVPQDQLA